MIGNVGLAISRAPVVVVGLERYVQRCVALISITHASAARRLAAAVVVRDDVVFAIERVVTSSYPGDRGHLGAGRTGILRPPAAAAQIAVDRAVAPVVAAGWIIDFAWPFSLGLRRRWRCRPRATGNKGVAAAPTNTAPGTPPRSGGKCAWPAIGPSPPPVRSSHFMGSPTRWEWYRYRSPSAGISRWWRRRCRARCCR